MQEIELPAAVEPLVTRLKGEKLKTEALRALTLPDRAMYVLALLMFRGLLSEELSTMQHIARSFWHLFRGILTQEDGELIINEWAERGLLAVLNDEGEGPEKVTVQFTLSETLRALLQAVYLNNHGRATIAFTAETVTAPVITLHPKD